MGGRHAGLIAQGHPVICPVVFTANQNINTVLYLYIWHFFIRVTDVASHPHSPRKQVFRSSWMAWTSAYAVLSSVMSLPILLSTWRERWLDRWRDTRPSPYVRQYCPCCPVVWPLVPSSYSMTRCCVADRGWRNTVSFTYHMIGSRHYCLSAVYSVLMIVGLCHLYRPNVKTVSVTWSDGALLLPVILSEARCSRSKPNCRDRGHIFWRHGWG